MRVSANALARFDVGAVMTGSSAKLRQPRWDVLSLGEVAATFRFREDGIYVPDVGGHAANVAISVVRMGGAAAIATRLGMDPLANAALAQFSRDGVSPDAIVRDADSATPHILYHAEDMRTIVRANTAMTRFRPAELPSSMVQRARVLHLAGDLLALSGSVRTAAELAVDQAHAGDVRVSLDLRCDGASWGEDVAQSAMLTMAARADIVFASHQDTALLFGTTKAEDALEAILSLGPQVIILRGADDGTWVATRTGKCLLPDPGVGEARLHGVAQDTFVGTYLSGLTAGDDLVETAGRSAQASALAATRLGDASAIPYLADLRQDIDAIIGKVRGPKPLADLQA